MLRLHILWIYDKRRNVLRIVQKSKSCELFYKDFKLKIQNVLLVEVEICYSY